MLPMRWKCGCSFDGTDYSGWQTQDGPLSIQQVVEECLSEIFKKETKAIGSGRTDAGVHAMEQVFHFDFEWKHDPGSLVEAMRSLLPDTVTPLFVEKVEDDFHARFSAVSKWYQYRIYLGQATALENRYSWSLHGDLALEAMAKATSLLKGTHDFGAFAANRGIEYKTTVRKMFRSEMLQEKDFLLLNFQANGFMYKMVRSLAGTVANVGLGRLSLDAFSELLKSAERTPMVFVAPAKGLFLKKVFY